ncbi:ParB-like protein [Phenylobacterium sp.]|uniref:ParB-like protein n=1 Tax=Phenylobacterium sp. TaxID=1871053 RepID=UPI00286C770B|nr:ParB-like protein [Phenylobacterium sp.]
MIDGLRDDPFRSLASALRRAGGFGKKAAPFSEFAWADFLRSRIQIEVVIADFAGALEQALILAGTPAAAGLPG